MPEKRIAVFDNDLKVEVFSFKGIMQNFPNHFHDHYVIGYIKSGNRLLLYKDKEYIIKPNDLILINQFANHACSQIDQKPLIWHGINIKKDILYQIAIHDFSFNNDIHFIKPVANDLNILSMLKKLHYLIINQVSSLDKVETFYYFMIDLIVKFADLNINKPILVDNKIQLVCNYIDTNFANQISIDELSGLLCMNKYTFIRTFTIQCGITPYQYLTNIRVNKAKKMLESGVSPLDTAILCGFSDQSHLTRFFKNFIGLTPKLYQNIFGD